MSLLYMKQKVFSLKDKYKIYDQNQNPVYHCTGKLLSFSHQKDLYDSKSMQHLYTLKRRLFHLLPHYDLLNPEGEVLASIRKHFSVFKHRIEINSSLGDFILDGDIFAHDFRISLNGADIVTVHKKWLSWGDSYEISIVNEEMKAFFVGMVVMIDDCLHSGRRRHN